MFQFYSREVYLLLALACMHIFIQENLWGGEVLFKNLF